MSNKNYGGPAYLDPTGRAWELAVYQPSKPVTAEEFNLLGDLPASVTQGLLRAAIPSGWLGEDPISSLSPVDDLVQAGSSPNTIDFPAMLAHVNGWVIPVDNTDKVGGSKVDLGAGPSGGGAKRTDVVILEVWRKLISNSSSVGKSVSGRIWWNGNVRIPLAEDGNLNFPDDTVNTALGVETSKRVQVQYRLRVVQGVDLFAYPSGLGDPSVVANSTPATAGSPNGSSTPYAYQPSSDDPGLWLAGDGTGSAGTVLGTVDGYMYAIPLCAVFRRNTTAFNRVNNHNGGVAASVGTSDRPDGAYHDVLTSRDTADLRRGVSLRGWQTSEVLEKNFHALLDNSLRTEWGQTSVGGGVNGHTLLIADEIGISSGNGGNGVLNGDTPGANFRGQFDCVRRRFSDRPTLEVMTVRVVPGTAAVSTATWQDGTVVTLTPTALAPYPFSNFDFPAFAPSETKIIDILGMTIHAANGSVDVGGTRSSDGGLYVHTSAVTGLGSAPMGPIQFSITNSSSALVTLSNDPLYIDLLVAYPAGCGLSASATEEFGSDSFSCNNPGALDSSAPTSYAEMYATEIDGVHREAHLEYKTTPQTFTVKAYRHAASYYTLPESAASLTSVTVNGTLRAASLSADGRTVVLGSPTSVGNTLIFTYEAARPLPQTGVQFTIYYHARAPQAVRGSLLGTTQSFVPKSISSHLYALTTGAGSLGEGYPFPLAYAQTGGVANPTSPFAGEYQLQGSPEVYVGDFNASTGLLRVPVYVPYTPDPKYVTFERVPSDVDIEGRAFFPTAPVTHYLPNAYGNPLADPRTHKNILPCLMELAEDSSIGRKGELFMVLLVRWADLDSHVSVEFGPTPNTTVASVYRINGNLLNRRS